MADKKSLKYFMRAQEDQIVTIPGPESFVDESGNRINLEVKVLSQREIDDIYDHYKERKIATDRKGNPIVSGDHVIFREDNDRTKAVQMLLVSALQYPNLKDQELMDYYKCVDVTEMPKLVFRGADEYNYVLREVMAALGMIEKDKDDLEAAKN